jgi:hypothetical protein
MPALGGPGGRKHRRSSSLRSLVFGSGDDDDNDGNSNGNGNGGIDDAQPLLGGGGGSGGSGGGGGGGKHSAKAAPLSMLQRVRKAAFG